MYNDTACLYFFVIFPLTSIGEFGTGISKRMNKGVRHEDYIVSAIRVGMA
jgi:hypothetical protein